MKINTIATFWEGVCDEARITEIDKRLMWGRQFLNPFAFDDLTGKRAFLKQQAYDILEVN